jgi:hypothetical protein
VVGERDPHGRFVKGNKEGSGRPKGLAELARSVCKGGTELVAFYCRVWHDEGQDIKYRLQAADWLGDRGWGKAVQISEYTGEGGGPLLITYVNDWRNQE